MNFIPKLIVDPEEKEFEPKTQDTQNKRNSQGFSKANQTPLTDAPSRNSNGRAMAQVLFSSQYKQCKRIRLETERNMQSLANDRHQSMQHISEMDRSKGLHENPSQGLESAEIDQENVKRGANTA